MTGRDLELCLIALRRIRSLDPKNVATQARQIAIEALMQVERPEGAKPC
jgi:hypothetical protein